MVVSKQYAKAPSAPPVAPFADVQFDAERQTFFDSRTGDLYRYYEG